ncbi:putative Ulp1 protease family catalytic domain, papain-like cysteine peptidase superfamily [Helianthus debilis subsp. tardiflorus]
MVNGDQKMMDLATFELIFFPILSNNCYYLLCFDIKNPLIVIIDNLDMQERNQTDKHRKECMITASEVKEHLVRYMRSVRHINAELVEAQTPIHLNLQWYTTAMDSGVYVMRHMETYMGTRRNKWDCGFATQKSKLNKQLLMAKKKYAAKIILSDINLHRARIVDAINSQAI